MLFCLIHLLLEFMLSHRTHAYCTHIHIRTDIHTQNTHTHTHTHTHTYCAITLSPLCSVQVPQGHEGSHKRVCTLFWLRKFVSFSAQTDWRFLEQATAHLGQHRKDWGEVDDLTVVMGSRHTRRDSSSQGTQTCHMLCMQLLLHLCFNCPDPYFIYEPSVVTNLFYHFSITDGSSVASLLSSCGPILDWGALLAATHFTRRCGLVHTLHTPHTLQNVTRTVLNGTFAVKYWV